MKKKNSLQEKIILNCLICPDECANYFRGADLLSLFIVESNTLMAGFGVIETNTITVCYMKMLLALCNECFNLFTIQ